MRHETIRCRCILCGGTIYVSDRAPTRVFCDRCHWHPESRAQLASKLRRAQLAIDSRRETYHDIPLTEPPRVTRLAELQTQLDALRAHLVQIGAIDDDT